MIIDIDDELNYMQRSHDSEFGSWLRFYQQQNPAMPLDCIAKLMGINYNQQFRENVRRVNRI